MFILLRRLQPFLLITIFLLDIIYLLAQELMGIDIFFGLSQNLSTEVQTIPAFAGALLVIANLLVFYFLVLKPSKRR